MTKKSKPSKATNVATIRLVEFGDESRVDAKVILKQAKRANLDQALIIGRDKNGELWASSSLNGAQSLWLIEKLRERVLEGSSWGVI